MAERRGEAAFATEEQHQIAHPQVSDDAANPLRKNVKITVENAKTVLQYLEKHGALVCSVHNYAVRNLAYHLREFHSIPAKERRAIVDLFRQYELYEPSRIPLPAPLGEPFKVLGRPKKAWPCEEPECEKISINDDTIRQHSNQVHGWKSSYTDDRYWHPVWVQSFFSTRGFQRYFTVDYEESEEQNDGENRGQSNRGAATASTSLQVTSVLQEWDQALEKQKLAQEKADSELAKTDRTGWFSRTR